MTQAIITLIQHKLGCFSMYLLNFVGVLLQENSLNLPEYC